MADKLNALLDKPDEFPDFEFLSYWQTQLNDALAITSFMAWVKVKSQSNFTTTITVCYFYSKIIYNYEQQLHY